MKLINVVRDFPICKDNKLGGELLGYQLIFENSIPESELRKWDAEKSVYPTNYQPRWSKQMEANDIKSGETRSIDGFEKKYGVKTIWVEINNGGHKWFAYVIDDGSIKEEIIKRLK